MYIIYVYHQIDFTHGSYNGKVGLSVCSIRTTMVLLIAKEIIYYIQIFLWCNASYLQGGRTDLSEAWKIVFNYISSESVYKSGSSPFIWVELIILRYEEDHQQNNGIEMLKQQGISFQILFSV